MNLDADTEVRDVGLDAFTEVLDMGLDAFAVHMLDTDLQDSWDDCMHTWASGGGELPFGRLDGKVAA